MLISYSLSSFLQGDLHAEANPVVIPLANQAYALCAGAVPFNFDGITYAKCRKKFGNTLGLTHAYPAGDIQATQVKAAGPDQQGLLAMHLCGLGLGCLGRSHDG